MLRLVATNTSILKSMITQQVTASVGVKIDLNLNLNNHISDLCKKASGKVSALARVAPFIGFDKGKLLMNSFLF